MHVKKESCSVFHSSQGRKSLNILQEYLLGRVIWNTAYPTYNSYGQSFAAADISNSGHRRD